MQRAIFGEANIVIWSCWNVWLMLNDENSYYMCLLDDLIDFRESQVELREHIDNLATGN